MRAKLNKDWGPLNNGSITLTTDEGEDIASIRICTVNPKIVDVSKFYAEFKRIAIELVKVINDKKKLH